MRNVDISPLYRHAIGFNIEQKDEHNYRITMAVAGFSEDALTLTQNENMLIVSGEIKASETKPTYVYQGRRMVCYILILYVKYQKQCNHVRSQSTSSSL